MKFKRVTDL